MTEIGVDIVFITLLFVFAAAMLVLVSGCARLGEKP
jgi:hypothetical protein